jgi:hypothetical protein
MASWKSFSSISGPSSISWRGMETRQWGRETAFAPNRVLNSWKVLKVTEDFGVFMTTSGKEKS